MSKPTPKDPPPGQTSTPSGGQLATPSTGADHPDRRVPQPVPSFIAMVVIPGLLAIVVNFIVLVAGQRSPQQAAIPSVLVGVVMAWWMNTRRIKRVNEFHEFHQAVENFGTPPAPRGGWANPTRGQKFNRWIDVTRKYRRRG